MEIYYIILELNRKPDTKHSIMRSLHALGKKHVRCGLFTSPNNKNKTVDFCSSLRNLLANTITWPDYDLHAKVQTLSVSATSLKSKFSSLYLKMLVVVTAAIYFSASWLCECRDELNHNDVGISLQRQQFVRCKSEKPRHEFSGLTKQKRSSNETKCRWKELKK
jgi:hypothetical protein